MKNPITTKIVLREETVIHDGNKTQKFSIYKYHNDEKLDSIQLNPDEMAQLRNSINLIDIKM